MPSTIKQHPARLEREMEEIRYRRPPGSRRLRDSLVLQHPGFAVLCVGLGLLIWLLWRGPSLDIAAEATRSLSEATAELAKATVSITDAIESSGRTDSLALATSHGMGNATEALSRAESATASAAALLDDVRIPSWLRVLIEMATAVFLSLGAAGAMTYCAWCWEPGIRGRAKMRLRSRNKARREYIEERLGNAMTSDDERAALSHFHSSRVLRWATVIPPTGDADNRALRGAYSLYADELLERVEALPDGVLFRIPTMVREVVAGQDGKLKSGFDWAVPSPEPNPNPVAPPAGSTQTPYGA